MGGAVRSTSFVTSIILISILLAGCGTPVEEHAPTAVPTDSSVPPEVPIPTDTPTPIPPTPTPIPAPGDTRTRSADGMTQVYVPAGTFTMGSTDDPDAYSRVCR